MPEKLPDYELWTPDNMGFNWWCGFCHKNPTKQALRHKDTADKKLHDAPAGHVMPICDNCAKERGYIARDDAYEDKLTDNFREFP